MACLKAPILARVHTDAIVVDPMLVKFLRPHQREGVCFMFDCVAGLKVPGGQGGWAASRGELHELSLWRQQRSLALSSSLCFGPRARCLNQEL